MTANITKEEFDKKCSELLQLLGAHRATNVMQRITLYVVAKTTKKLTPYIEDETVTLADRGQLISDLIEIVKTNAWDKLPPPPNGQAQPNGAPATPLKPLVNLAPPAPKPAPAPVPEPVGVLVNAVEPDATPDADDPIAIITEQLERLTKPKGKTLTEQDIMRIVRREMAACLVTIAGILNK